jgi:two-component system cell cycle sensor histidine kinase/response regulator CckA
VATILIVDDRPTNREYLVTLLGYGGHRLLQAADGAEALATARAEQPDLVISDILMPTMDGYEFVRQLRGTPAIMHTPVIFFTAHYHEREAQALARACGVSHVLTKPCEPEVVVGTVETALGLTPPPLSPAAPEQFDREHLRLLTDKLSEKAEDLRRANARLTALVDLGLELGAERDPRQMLQSFCHAAREIIGARYAIAGILASDDIGLRYFFTSGMDAEISTRLGAQDPPLGGAGTVLRESRCVRLHNPGGNPAAIDFPSSYPPIHSWLGAPIVSPGHVYGWLGLLNKVGAEVFSDEEERLAAILAAQVGRIYENGSLYADMRHHAAELELEVAERKQVEQRLATQHAVVSILAQAPALGDAAPQFLQAICETAGWEVGCVWEVDPAANLLRCVTLWHVPGVHFIEFTDQCRRTTFPPGVGLPGRVWASGQTAWIVDVTDDTNFPRHLTAAKVGLHGAFAFPIHLGSQILGVVEFFSREIRQPDAELLLMFDSLGSQIAQFLERKRAEEGLVHQANLANLGADIGTALTKADTQREMLQHCAAALVRYLDAAFARIWTISAAGDVLELAASAGLYTHLDGPHSRVPVGRFKIGLIAQEHKPHLTNDVQNDPRVTDKEWARREDMVAFAGYPLLIGDRLVGVMAMFARHRLAESVLQVMGAVASQIALGIERKRAEAAVRDSEARKAAILHASLDAIITMDHEGKIRGWNPAAQRIFGYSESAVLGRQLADLIIPPTLRGRHVQGLAHYLATGQGAVLEKRLELPALRADGSEFPVELTVTRIAVEGQAMFTGYLRDITERKRLEDQFRQAQKMEAVGQLAGGVAHDFNNLLTVIMGYSDVALGSLRAGEPLREMIAQIKKAGGRAGSLTRQLLAFSRKQVLVPVVLDLNGLLADMEKMLPRLLGEDIELVITKTPHLWPVKADIGQIEQIIMNLAVNARDAMPQGGKLSIETTNVELDETYRTSHPDIVPGRYAMLGVSDTGCGMDGATKSRIFEPFFTTKGPEKGTGLGLATVWGIVKQSEGHIEVYSEVGIGTAFKIYLPRTGETAEIVKTPAGLAKPPRSTETVLLVEDEEGVRTLSRMILESHGYTVLEAKDGTEALLLAEQHQGTIHLLVSDVVMPKMSGRELGERLAVLRPDMKVLYFSGYTDDAIVRHGIVDAKTPFLQKPFSPLGLGRKVREVLDMQVERPRDD